MAKHSSNEVASTSITCPQPQTVRYGLQMPLSALYRRASTAQKGDPGKKTGGKQITGLLVITTCVALRYL